jgi:hypothetical protein
VGLWGGYTSSILHSSLKSYLFHTLFHQMLESNCTGLFCDYTGRCWSIRRSNAHCPRRKPYQPMTRRKDTALYTHIDKISQTDHNKVCGESLVPMVNINLPVDASTVSKSYATCEKRSTYIENNLRPRPSQSRMYISPQSCTFRDHYID